MNQITKEELTNIYHSSRSGWILKIKKWFSDGKLEILNDIEGDELREKIFRFLFPEKSLGCEICGNQTKFISMKNGFNQTCSKSCAMKKKWKSVTPEQEIERQKRRIKTNLEKYGVKDPMQTKEIADKISKVAKQRSQKDRDNITEKRKTTNLEKYGIDFTQKLNQTKEKVKQSCLQKFGVENPSQSKKCKEKRKQTHIEKFGVENAFQSEIIKEKIKKTNLKKFGVENPSQSPLIMDKKITTHLMNFGVSFPAQHLETFEKQQKNKYKRKDTSLPSGKTVILQGNEPYTLLNDLLLKYSENEIIIGSKNMPEIWYYQDNKKHRYFPDFFIPKENKIIEVKSEYTMKIHLEKNLLKKKRCIEMGFDFEFRIYDRKMNLVDEKEFL